MSLIVTVNHARRAGLCAFGMRTWAARHGLDFAAFLAAGIAAEKLAATGDAMALKAIEQAEREATEAAHGGA